MSHPKQTIANGAQKIFRMKHLTEDDFGDGYASISGHDGELCTVVELATDNGLGDRDFEYYDIKFANGEKFCAVSGFHMDNLGTTALPSLTLLKTVINLL